MVLTETEKSLKKAFLIKALFTPYLRISNNEISNSYLIDTPACSITICIIQDYRQENSIIRENTIMSNLLPYRSTESIICDQNALYNQKHRILSLFLSFTTISNISINKEDWRNIINRLMFIDHMFFKYNKLNRNDLTLFISKIQKKYIKNT